MKSLATTALCLMAGIMPMHADEDKPTVHLNLQTRASYVNNRIGSEVQHDASGMKGDYLFLSLYGNINDRLSYNWRQRVNSKITRNDISDAARRMPCSTCSCARSSAPSHWFSLGTTLSSTSRRLDAVKSCCLTCNCPVRA